MEINGHELEMRYVNDIRIIKECKKSKVTKVLFASKIKECKSRLKKRLERLEKSFTDGFLDKEAYHIWKQMITEVI